MAGVWVGCSSNVVRQMCLSVPSDISSGPIVVSGSCRGLHALQRDLVVPVRFGEPKLPEPWGTVESECPEQSGGLYGCPTGIPGDSLNRWKWTQCWNHRVSTTRSSGFAGLGTGLQLDRPPTCPCPGSGHGHYFRQDFRNSPRESLVGTFQAARTRIRHPEAECLHRLTESFVGVSSVACVPTNPCRTSRQPRFASS